MSNTGTISLEEDTRIIRRNIAKGFLSMDTAEKALKDLPDLADMAEYVDPTASDEDDEAGLADDAEAGDEA
jgi:hypothetical protein